MNLQLEFPESLPGKLELEIRAVHQPGLRSPHIQSHTHEYHRMTSEQSDSGSNQDT